MRNSSITTVERLHAFDMERGVVDSLQNCDGSLLSRVRFYWSRIQRSFARLAAQMGMTPRSFAPAILRSGPSMPQLKSRQRRANLG